MPRQALLLMLLLAAPALATESGPARAVAQQAVRCALHADLAAGIESDPALKARWLEQKAALVVLAVRSGASTDDLDGWIAEFADEIVRRMSKRSTMC
jgi:hypothetical protein